MRCRSLGGPHDCFYLVHRLFDPYSMGVSSRQAVVKHAFSSKDNPRQQVLTKTHRAYLNHGRKLCSIVASVKMSKDAIQRLSEMSSTSIPRIRLRSKMTTSSTNSTMLVRHLGMISRTRGVLARRHRLNRALDSLEIMKVASRTHEARLSLLDVCLATLH